MTVPHYRSCRYCGTLFQHETDIDSDGARCPTCKERHDMAGKLRKGYTFGKTQPNTVKLIDCSGCWARVWVRKDVNSTYCPSCSNEMNMRRTGKETYTVDYQGGSYGVYKNRKPGDCKPKKPAHVIRDDNWNKMFPAAVEPELPFTEPEPPFAGADIWLDTPDTPKHLEFF